MFKFFKRNNDLALERAQKLLQHINSEAYKAGEDYKREPSDKNLKIWNTWLAKAEVQANIVQYHLEEQSQRDDRINNK